MLRNGSVKAVNVHCDNFAPEAIATGEQEQIKNKTKPDKQVSKTKQTKNPNQNKISTECFDIISSCTHLVSKIALFIRFLHGLIVYF